MARSLADQYPNIGKHMIACMAETWFLQMQQALDKADAQTMAPQLAAIERGIQELKERHFAAATASGEVSTCRLCSGSGKGFLGSVCGKCRGAGVLAKGDRMLPQGLLDAAWAKAGSGEAGDG